MVVSPAFWRNRRVFITGHTGFKGSWLALWLTELGAEVYGYALAPTQPSLYQQLGLDTRLQSTIADVRDAATLTAAIDSAQPEVIFHLAAQPIVLDSYQQPVATFATNAMGTVNLLEACRHTSSVKTIIVVTSDKCYQNDDTNRDSFHEASPLGGHDPYSASKACAELIARSYYQSFFKDSDIQLATARAGNVIGGGDWANYRLLPDIITAFAEQKTLAIRHPHAVRPWQHVLESLSGYLQLAKHNLSSHAQYCGAWNFGPELSQVATVSDILTIIKPMLPELSIDMGDASLHEARYLHLNSEKARTELGWRNRWDLTATLEHTIDWYRAYLSGADMRAYSLEQLHHYNQRNSSHEHNTKLQTVNDLCGV